MVLLSHLLTVAAATSEPIKKAAGEAASKLPEINTLGDALSVGCSVTVQGLVTVFAVLLILMFVLMIMKVIFYKDPAKTAPTVQVQEPVVEEKATAADEVEDEELIAVLTAAVAASLNTSTYNLKIKSYRRIGSNAPVWNKAGRTDTINSRF